MMPNKTYAQAAMDMRSTVALMRTQILFIYGNVDTKKYILDLMMKVLRQQKTARRWI